MPLINGLKYSCEPCIRGHRATSCAHTDRILVEVRKPGRPLESCGHNLNTCQCGRLAELFTVGDVLPIASPQQIGSSDFLVTTPPLPTVTSPTTSSRLPPTSRERRKSEKPRVNKRGSRKKSTTSTESGTLASTPPRNRGSRETSALIDDSPTGPRTRTVYDSSLSTSSPIVPESTYAFQSAQGYQPQPQPPYLPSMVDGLGMRYHMHKQPQPHQDYLGYGNSGSGGGTQHGYGPGMGLQYEYSSPVQAQPQHFQMPGPTYQSRIEDVRRRDGEGEGERREGDEESDGEVRSQYIVATQDTMWRAAP